MKENNRSVVPFFIIGNPRSGTTLVRLMLNNHPDVVVPPESGFSLWLAEDYSNKDFPIYEIYLDEGEYGFHLKYKVIG